MLFSRHDLYRFHWHIVNTCRSDPPVSFNFEPLAAVRNLSIPPTYYEILVVGSDQKIDNGICPPQYVTVVQRVCMVMSCSLRLTGFAGSDVRYICSQCEFTDKIRAAFAQSTMETV
jgi:hypothetical protein